MKNETDEMLYANDDGDCDDVCECCGGDGTVEYIDHPEVWGEDCPSEMNHLVPCPECAARERRAAYERLAKGETK